MNTTASSGTLLGHPKGLFLLFGTELWERFSYYAMRAILVLYLVDAVQGMGWNNTKALNLYGTFSMLVYLTPLIGGWLADNFIGQRRSIMIGGALMAAGQFTLGAPDAWVAGAEEAVFYTGLGLLVIGNGMFKPNISTMVGDLYEDGDNRRDGAFTIFYMGINVGAFLSGIVVGSVVATFGGNWKAGFICAGIGMLLSLVLQLTLAQKLLGDIGRQPAARREKAEQQERREKALTREEFDRIKVIFILSVFTIIFWAGFEQAGGLMNIYANQFTDRPIDGFEVPTTWFQSLNPLFIIVFAPVMAGLWIRMGENEPTSPVKFAWAMILLAIGFLFMVGATLQQGGDTSVKTSMLWLVGAYFFHTVGELCLSPISLSMVTKLAPLRLASLLMGIWFFFTGLANYVAGFVGSFIGHGDEESMVENALAIFGGIAITAIIAAILLLLLADKLIYWMHGAEGAHVVDENKALEEELEVTGLHEAMPREHSR